MSLLRILLEAFSCLVSNKMRSSLTILGIVIGVGSVVAMMSLGEGVKSSINSEIASMGSNLIFIYPGNMSETVRNMKQLTMGDVADISNQTQAPSIEQVVPVVSGTMMVQSERKSDEMQVMGVTPNFQEMRNYQLSEGYIFDNEQVLGQASVVVLGATAANIFYNRETDLVGESLRINGQPFQVIGVFRHKGGREDDSIILTPLTTAQTRLFPSMGQTISEIYIQAIDQNSLTKAIEEIQTILRARHRIQPGNPDDFMVINQKAFAKSAEQITNTFTLFLSGVAAVSLLVGGIGIMNIMLVSVTERTREIGLRKALGAKRAQILTQFLVESGLLSLLGGLIGILLGFIISFVVASIAVSSGVSLSASLSFKAILIATIFSTGVGLFFGIYPANRAASLQPVEALRHE